MADESLKIPRINGCLISQYYTRDFRQIPIYGVLPVARSLLNAASACACQRNISMRVIYQKRITILLIYY